MYANIAVYSLTHHELNEISTKNITKFFMDTDLFSRQMSKQNFDCQDNLANKSKHPASEA